MYHRVPGHCLAETPRTVSTVLKTALNYYVTTSDDRAKLAGEMKGIEDVRARR